MVQMYSISALADTQIRVYTYQLKDFGGIIRFANLSVIHCSWVMTLKCDSGETSECAILIHRIHKIKPGASYQ